MRKILLLTSIIFLFIQEIKSFDSDFWKELTQEEKQYLQKKNELIIGVPLHWPPYEYIDTSGIYSGYCADYFNLICNKTGLSYKLKLDEWPIIIEKIKNKEIDVLPGAYFTLERSQYITFLEPYQSQKYVVICKNIRNITRIEDLFNKRLSVLRGWATNSYLKSKYPHIKQVEVSDEEVLLSNIFLDYTDAALIDVGSLAFLSNKYHLKNFKTAFTLDAKFDLCIGIQKDNEILASILSKASKAITQKELDRLSNKWLTINQLHERLSIKKIATIASIVLLIILIILYWNFRLRRVVAERTKEIEAQFNLLLLQKKTLEKTQKIYSSIFETSINGVFLYSENILVDCNAEALKIFKRSKSDFQSTYPFFYSPERQLRNENSEEASKELLIRSGKGERLVFEWEFVNGNGLVFDAEVNIFPFDNELQQYQTIIIRDISKRKSAEKALAVYAQNLENLVDVRTDELTKSNSTLQAVNEELQSTNEELESTVEELENEIELRQKVQIQLETSQEMLSCFIKQSFEGITIISIEGLILEWNSQMFDITGVSSNEVVGRYLWDIDSKYLVSMPGYNNEISSLESSFKKFVVNSNLGKSASFQAIIKDPNGKIKNIEVFFFPIITSTSKYIGRLCRDLTEKVKTEQELERHRELLEFIAATETEKSNQLSIQLKYLFDNTNDVVLVVEKKKNSNWYVSNCSLILAERLNMPISEITSKPLFNILPEDISQRIINASEKVLNEQQKLILHSIVINFNNKEYYFNITIIPIIDLPGQVAFFIHNVTQQQLMINTIKERQAFLTTLLDNAPLEFWAIDKNKKLTVINSRAKSRYGDSLELEIDLLDINKVLKSNILISSHLALKGKTINREIQFTENNKNNYLLISVNPLIVDKEIIGAIGINVDITEHREAIAQIIESENKLLNIFNCTSDVISLIDFETKTYIDVNQSFLQNIGKKYDEVIGKTREELNVWYNNEEKQKYQKLLFKEGFVRNYEMVWNTSNGPKYYLISSELITINNKKLILTNSKYIDETKKLNLSLLENEERLKTITDSITNYVYKVIVDNNSNIVVEHNESSVGIIGYTKHELAQNNHLWHTIIYDTDKDKVVDFIKNITHNNLQSIDYRLKHKDGHLVWIRNTFVITKENEEYKEFSAIVSDITEQKKLEQQVILSAIEAEENERRKLAADLHDDVGPLLSSLNMHLSMLARNQTTSEQQNLFNEIIAILKESITSVREISHNISPQILTHYGLKSAINFFLTNKKSQLNINFDSNFENFRISEIKELMLYRIVKELINNSTKHANAKNINILLNKNENNIRFSYSDDGKGFDIKQYFESSQKGIGLLNIISRIESIGGQHYMYSEPNKGFYFKVDFTT